MGRLRRTLMAASMAAGLLLPASNASGRERCSAVYRKGPLKTYMRKTRRATIIHSPLFEEGRYVRLSLPKAYVREARRAARKLVKPKRARFLANVIQMNLSKAYKVIIPGKVTRFTCVPVKETQPSARPAPTPAVRPEPRRAAPRPAENKRRRLIFLDEPVARPTYASPITPALKGGWGTKGNPYRVNIPVPSSKSNGTVLYSSPLPADLSRIGAGMVHFKLQFVSKQVESRTTSRGKLRGAVYRIVYNVIYQKARAAGKTDFTDAGLRGSIGRIIGAARSDPDVRKYAR